MKDTSAETPGEDESREARDESHARNPEFSALLEAFRIIRESPGFSPASARVLASCKKLTGAAAGFIVVESEGKSENNLLLVDTGGEGCSAGSTLPSPLRELQGEVQRSARTIYVNDFPFSGGEKLLSAEQAAIDNALIAPLTIGGKAVGAMGFWNKPGGFAESDARLAAAFGETAAISLHHDRMLKELAKSEEAIEKLNKVLSHRVAEIEETNKGLEAFAYSVSHDLRAPLRHIAGFVNLLKERNGETLDEQSRHYLSIISDAASRMGVLIDELLSFSWLGLSPMTRTQIDLRVMVREILRDLEEEMQNRDVVWRIAELPVVSGDCAMLRIAMANLISNALKFTQPRPRPEIEIGCLPGDASGITVFVRDNGVGFDMRYADKLFGVFQRLHSGNEFKGNGIGLANVRRVISRHGGRAWAEGRVDHGATFYFSLPHAPEDEGA